MSDLANFGACRYCGNFIKTADISGHGNGVCNGGTSYASSTASRTAEKSYSQSEVKELLTGLLKEIEGCSTEDYEDQEEANSRKVGLSDIRTIFTKLQEKV